MLISSRLIDRGITVFQAFISTGTNVDYIFSPGEIEHRRIPCVRIFEVLVARPDIRVRLWSLYSLPELWFQIRFLVLDDKEGLIVCLN